MAISNCIRIIYYIYQFLNAILLPYYYENENQYSSLKCFVLSSLLAWATFEDFRLKFPSRSKYKQVNGQPGLSVSSSEKKCTILDIISFLPQKIYPNSSKSSRDIYPQNRNIRQTVPISIVEEKLLDLFSCLVPNFSMDLKSERKHRFSKPNKKDSGQIDAS